LVAPDSRQDGEQLDGELGDTESDPGSADRDVEGKLVSVEHRPEELQARIEQQARGVGAKAVGGIGVMKAAHPSHDRCV
jgi:hypothetical protein